MNLSSEVARVQEVRTTKISWTQIPQAPNYEVSKEGLIRRGITKRVLTQQVAPSGHHYVQLRLGGQNGRSFKLWIHRAVLSAFVRFPWPNEECCHKDGNPANNAVKNLYWGTRLENVADKQRHGRQPRGERIGTAVLNDAQVIEIRRRHGTQSLRTLAKEFGVSHTEIRRVAIRMKWRHINAE